MTSRWSRRRGSTRSGAGACRAPSPAAGCGRARTASQAARVRAGSARPLGRSRSGELLQLSPVARELGSLRLDYVRRGPLDEAGVGELALRARHLRLEGVAPLGDRPADLLGVDLVRREDLHRPEGGQRLAL